MICEGLKTLLYLIVYIFAFYHKRLYIQMLVVEGSNHLQGSLNVQLFFVVVFFYTSICNLHVCSLSFDNQSDKD